MLAKLICLILLTLLVSVEACQPQKVNQPEPLQTAINEPGAIKSEITKSDSILSAVLEQIRLVPACNSLTNLDYLKTLVNQEGIVEEYEHPPYKWFVIKYEGGVPTNYLRPCNLPDEFKQVGLRIRFSGTVFQPKDMAFTQISSVPAVFTQVQKAVSGNE